MIWMDPLMGFVGAALVFKWSLGLLRTTSRVLLDRQGPAEAREKIRQGLEADKESRVTDLHLWSIGPNTSCLIAAVLSKNDKASDDYKQMLPSDLNLAHASIEVNPTGSGGREQ